ncbi:Aldo/keto reductase family-domain-containing protein [Zopfochytrium polystomum]|nr:Aldo/keto reductase family-domain-containing protein [Zopfochytrium polystomum]
MATETSTTSASRTIPSPLVRPIAAVAASTGQAGGGPLRFSPVALGGGAFNPQYDNYDEKNDPAGTVAVATLRRAFQLGVNLVDTSPYYGRSESIIGGALAVLADEFPRSSYFISTKCGRYGPTKAEFDYSAARVRASVQESLRRLKTDYLDVVFCHDVEFVEDRMVLEEALPVLFDLKSQGIIKMVGISGYPLPVLERLAAAWYAAHPTSPLDIVLSYCHYTLHSVDLVPAIPRLRSRGGVGTVLCASPLSMRMLTSFGPPAWHPAKPTLRDAVAQARALCDDRGVDIAEVATLFGFGFGFDDFVIGASTPEEVERAVANWHRVAGDVGDDDPDRESRLELLRRVLDILKPFWDYEWASP